MVWHKAAEYDCMEIGDAQGEYIKILIRQDVTASIRKKSRRWIGAKAFGLLIGNKYKDKDCIMVYIEDVVAVGNIGAKRDNLIFTDKKWIRFKEQIYKNNPGKEIVGWYRVRSGWGAMLTEEDQWLHQNFFDKPWQIIYLFDNKNNNFNMYYWHQQGPRRSRGYYQLRENARENSNKKLNKEFDIGKLLLRCAAALAAALLSIALYIRYVHPYLPSFNRRSRDSIEIEPQENDKDNYNLVQLEENALDRQEFGNVQEPHPEQSDKEQEEESPELKKDDIEMLAEEQAANKDTISEDAEAGINESTEEGENNTESVQEDENIEETEAFSGDEVIIHVIKPGDTLSGISKQYYGDSNYGAALGKLNRISDHRSLRIGDYLIIPSKDEIEQWK